MNRIGRALLLLAVTVAIGLPLLAILDSHLRGPAIHEADLGLVGPAPVVQALAASDADSPFTVITFGTGIREDPAATVADVRSRVRDGRLDAAVAIDLRAPADTLLVSRAHSHEFVDAVRARLEPIMAGYGRDLEVERVDPPAGADVVWLPSALVAGWFLVGVIAAAVAAAVRGPAAATALRGQLRMGAFVVVGLVAGAASTGLAVPVAGAPWLPVLLVGAAATTVAAWLGTALAGLLGLPGLTAGAALLLGPVTTLLTAEAAVLPSPWFELFGIAPQAAAVRLTEQAVFDLDGPVVRDALMVASWAAIAVVALLVERRLRPAAPKVPAATR